MNGFGVVGYECGVVREEQFSKVGALYSSSFGYLYAVHPADGFKHCRHADDEEVRAQRAPLSDAPVLRVLLAGVCVDLDPESGFFVQVLDRYNDFLWDFVFAEGERNFALRQAVECFFPVKEACCDWVARPFRLV